MESTSQNFGNLRNPSLSPDVIPGFLSSEWNGWDDFYAAGGVGIADKISYPSDYSDTRNAPVSVRALMNNGANARADSDYLISQNVPTTNELLTLGIDTTGTNEPVPLTVSLDPITQQPVITHQTVSPIATTQTATATQTATQSSGIKATLNSLIANAQENPLLYGGAALALLLLLSSGGDSKRK